MEEQIQSNDLMKEPMTYKSKPIKFSDLFEPFLMDEKIKNFIEDVKLVADEIRQKKATGQINA